MAITLRCLSCGTAITAPDSGAGKKGRCTVCRSIMDIPASAGDPDAPPVPLVPAPAGSVALAYSPMREALKRVQQNNLPGADDDAPYDPVMSPRCSVLPGNGMSKEVPTRKSPPSSAKPPPQVNVPENAPQSTGTHWPSVGRWIIIVLRILLRTLGKR